jgi:anti-sigma factor RsiW
MTEPMNRCDQILELFSLHLDDELDEVEQRRMARHLQRCAECARAFRELRAVDIVLRHAPVKLAPGGFTERAVAAAFDANLRHNALLGFLILLVGTVVIGSLYLLGNLDVLWVLGATLLAPGFFGQGPVSLGETFQALGVAARTGLTVLSILRDLLVGPLLLPLLMAMLSTVLLGIILRTTGGGPMRSA